MYGYHPPEVEKVKPLTERQKDERRKTIDLLIEQLNAQPHYPPCLKYHGRPGANCICWMALAVEFLLAVRATDT